MANNIPSVDVTYVNLINKVFLTGERRGDRTGTGTTSVFGVFETYDMKDSFPLLQLKKTHFKSVIEELLWFISGSTNVKDLQAKGVSIWDEWADPETGELPEIYGKQWSRYEDVRIVSEENLSSLVEKHSDFVVAGKLEGTDDVVVKRTINQVDALIKGIKENPTSRRHILNAWNVQTVEEAALPPCHVLYQFYVTSDGELDCLFYMRSSDIFLGKPFNIASAAALTYMIAQQTDLVPGKLHFVGGDNHIYQNHTDQAMMAAERLTVPTEDNKVGVRDFRRPQLEIKKRDSIHDYTFEDFILTRYAPLSAIKADVAV